MLGLTAAALQGQRYTFRQFGPSDGLTNLGITSLLQDHAGFLWVGTDNGLFRYDGKVFQSYAHAEGLPNSEIRSLAESPQGVLWVATQNGIARSLRGRFVPVDVGMKGIFQTLAFDSHGALYLEHESAILRGDPDGSDSYTFKTIVQGEVGGLSVQGNEAWFRKDGDLWHLHGNAIDPIGKAAGLPDDRWSATTHDSNGNLWVRSGVQLFELPRGGQQFIDRSEGISQAMRASLFADRHGRVFVSTNSGVVMLDGEKRTYIDPQHGLPTDVTGTVLIDRDETLWIGMRGGGLIRRLGHGEWLGWTREDGLLNNSIWSVLHDRTGRLWVGTSNGLNLFAADGKPAHTWTAQTGLTGASVFSLLELPSGQVLAGTVPAGLTCFSADGKLVHAYGPPSGLVMNQVNSMALDKEGRLWVAGVGGFFRSKAPITSGGGLSPGLSFDRISIPGIPDKAYFHDVLMEEDGGLWITTSSGLAHFDGNSWRILSERDGLASVDVSAMVLGKGEIWVAYRDALGIARIRMHGLQAEITNVTQRDGLSSGLIYAMVFDHSGRLWASTDNGVDVLDQGRWRHYGTEDGLIWDDGDDLAMSVDGDGSVWVGTSRGLSRYTALPFPLPEVPATVVLTSIQGASQEFQPSDEPVLPHAQDSLVIRFSSLSFSSQAQTRYRYRLIGRNKTWTETQESSVRFESLPGGSYTFEVIAAGPNGEWSPVPARFAFSVTRPWWQTWWFIAACAVAVFLVGQALWWYRVWALLLQKERLEKVVVERTAELQESHRRLEEIAYYDALTSLPNRRMFTEQFRSRLAIAKRQRSNFVLLLIDLDDFKEINDTFGHDAGDAVLVETAELLRAAVRESDCVARLGGDEFAILLMSPTDPEGIAMISRRIIESFAPGMWFKGAKLAARCSVGVAVYPVDGETQDTLYKSADMALYEAKRQGGNASRRYSQELQKEGAGHAPAEA